jgi:hypothetical protein
MARGAILLAFWGAARATRVHYFDEEGFALEFNLRYDIFIIKHPNKSYSNKGQPSLFRGNNSGIPSVSKHKSLRNGRQIFDLPRASL